MIHFFPKFGRDVSDTPFARALLRLGVPHRILAENLNRQYRTRAALLLRIYPGLVWLTTRSACRSLLLSRPAPEAVVVSSDVEALIFGFLVRLFRRRTKVVFETFIMTPRQSPAARTAHRLYYRFVLYLTDLAICHSSLEATQYVEMFAGTRAQFVCLPFGMSVAGADQLRADFGAASLACDVIVTAGRSGRDYKTLVDAVNGLPCKLRIICDWERPTQNIAENDQVTILRQCFGREYLEELAKARLVVVPIGLQDISAGQMVLLQAFALGKPTIVTETATTPEYAVDGREALFVKFADVADMRDKIQSLLIDEARCRQLGRRALERFESEFSTEAYVARLVETIRQLTLVEGAGRKARAPVSASG